MKNKYGRLCGTGMASMLDRLEKLFDLTPNAHRTSWDVVSVNAIDDDVIVGAQLVEDKGGEIVVTFQCTCGGFGSFSYIKVGSAHKDEVFQLAYRRTLEVAKATKGIY